MNFLNKIDNRLGDSTLWQFIKFNLVSFSITLLQLALANLLPLILDSVTTVLPPFLRPFLSAGNTFYGTVPVCG